MSEVGTADGGDIRSAVEKAIDSAAETETTQVATSAAPAATEAPNPAAAEPQSGEQLSLLETPEAKQAKEGEQQPAAGDKPLEPNAKWSKEDKDHFVKIDRKSQQFLLDREKAMEADYTRKTQEISALRRDYEPVDKLFSPYRDQMRQSGQTPHSLIEGWVNVEQALMGGKGIDVIKGIIQGYKIDPQALMAALNGQAPAPQEGQQPQPQPAQLPPEVLQKLSMVDQFKSRFDAEDKARADAEIAKVSNEIEDFKSAKDSQGNALHPHFDELEQDMAVLAQVVRAQGKTPTLQDLYEKAVYANPSTRAKVLSAEKQSEEKRAKDEARAKAEKARKASSSVTGSPASGASQPLTNGRDSSMSLRDQISQSYSEVAP